MVELDLQLKLSLVPQTLAPSASLSLEKHLQQRLAPTIVDKSIITFVLKYVNCPQNPPSPLENVRHKIYRLQLCQSLLLFHP